MDLKDDKKIPDFFSNRAQIRSDEEENVAKTEPKMPVFDVETQFSEEVDEVPYDFRTEYKDRIEQTFANDEESERKFSSVRLHAIGIGVLIGVLIALLFSIFLFAEKADDLGDFLFIGTWTGELITGTHNEANPIYSKDLTDAVRTYN